MKWLIVEDALRDRKGHWLEYVSTFVRGLRALGDEVEVLCDRRAEGFVMEQTGALPVLPESIWHRMGDGAGAVKRYLRVPGHAVATFFAMRKVFRGFNHGLHNRAPGQARDGATEGWPEERGSGNERVKLTRMGSEQGDAQGTCAGAAFSNPFTSELARDAENSSLTRSASGHASSPGTSYSLPVTAPDAQALDTRLSTLDSSPASPGWIFVPTVLVHHLLGWWMLLKAGSVPKESRVLLFFPNLPIRLDDAGKAHWNGGPTTKLMAWLFGQLRNEVESGRVILGVETHAMRRALEALIRMPVVYLPHPVEAQEKTRVERRESRASSPANSNSPPGTSALPIVFGCYGAARWEKGSDIFQEAIRLVLDGVISTTKCTKGHEKGEGISTAIERQGGRENRKFGKAEGRATKSWPQRGAASGTMQVKEQSKFGPKGEGVGMTKSNNSDIQGWGDSGLCLDKPSGAAFSNPSTSELARDSENTSPSRSASAPADALRADHTGLGSAGGNQLADSKDFLEGQSQAGLQMDNQKDPTIRTANDPSASGEYSSSVLIREIRGQNSSSSETSHSALDSSLAAIAAGRPLRFAIQWVEDFRDDSGNLVSIDPWLKNHPQVEVIDHYFQGDEYERHLERTDVMVLPYRSPYRLRVSRVVIEAMMSGMPVIATKGTTLFEQAKEYGTVVACDGADAKSLAEAIWNLVTDFERMQHEAHGKSEIARTNFSVKYFRELLIKCSSPSLHFLKNN